MTDVIQILKPGWRAFDASGDVLSGAVIYCYDANTTTPRTIYSDKGLSTALGTTVTCDSGGYPTSDGSAKVELYTGNTAYKLTLKDSGGSTIWSHDNIVGALDTSGFLTSGELTPQTPVTNISVDTSPTSEDAAAYYNVNCSGGTVAINLPAASTLDNGWYIKVRHDGTANAVVIVANGSDVQKIGNHAGVTSFSLTDRGAVATITCDGTGFKVEQSSPSLFNTIGIIRIADRLSAPPVSPATGARYILTTTPSGDWSTYAEHDIVEKASTGWFKITPPTDCGWMAYVQDEDQNYQFIGSAWQAAYATNTEAAAGSAANKALVPANFAYLPGCLLGVLEDRKTAGTDPQSIGSSWADRNLNSERYDRLSILSISSNQFTISEAGTYEIFWESPFFGGAAKSRLYNVSDASEVEIGSQGRWTGGTGSTWYQSTGIARVTISGSKTFSIQARGSGAGGAYSDVDSKQEIYTRVIIRRG
ncbi:protein of unknown function [Hyphomicrobium sp. 1Nfss2.1]|uniref:DUF2793 domain-containing protein n=1 Tax=Hyphomicrobium sp. 1Nfss2.1 TaxID=3413936 RepID=UPI003C7B7879